MILILTPSSLAIIIESVVLPNPGGPYSKTWSSDSFLSFAASMNTFKFSFTLSCPIYSDKTCGLNGLSESNSMSSSISLVLKILFS